MPVCSFCNRREESDDLREFQGTVEAIWYLFAVEAEMRGLPLLVGPHEDITYCHTKCLNGLVFGQLKEER